MILSILLGIIVVIAIGIVLFARDSSPLWISTLILYSAAAFLAAYTLSSASILAILSVPLGIYLAWLARDELVPGRPWFIVLICLGLATSFLGYTPLLYAGISIALCSALALILSYRPRWARARGTWESKV